jgi:hypothetical protein
MSATSSSFAPVPGAAGGPRARAEGSGWILYSGLLILMAGCLNVVSGFAAIDNANFFVNDTKFVISDLNVWGWVHLCLGVVLVVTAVGIFVRNTLAMWVAIVALMFDAVSQLFFLPANPWWAVSVFALDMLAMYGLVVHGTKASD